MHPPEPPLLPPSQPQLNFAAKRLVILIVSETGKMSKIAVSSVRQTVQTLLKESQDKHRNFNETVELQSEYLSTCTVVALVNAVQLFLTIPRHPLLVLSRSQEL